MTEILRNAHAGEEAFIQEFLEMIDSAQVQWDMIKLVLFHVKDIFDLMNMQTTGVVRV